MTNREKWVSLIEDGILEDAICREFVTPLIDEACPGCPLGSLCRSYANGNGDITFEQYMESVTDWLNKESE